MGVSLNAAFKKNGETRTQEIIHQFVISFFAPIYFVSIGMKANFLANFDLPLVLLVIAIATIGKVVGVSIGALIGGTSLRDSFAIGFGMNARGAIEMILATVALDHGFNRPAHLRCPDHNGSGHIDGQRPVDAAADQENFEDAR